MADGYMLTSEERERLILEHLPKVRWIASGIHERLPAGVSEEDLVSTGIVGLIHAIDNYDPSRNASLWTYAEYKIRGAILDSVRGLDGIPAHKRKQLKQVQDAMAAAEQRCGRAAGEEEIALELGIGLPQYQKLLLELRGVTLGSLDAPAGHTTEGTLVRFIADPQAEDPAGVYERAEIEAILAAGIETIPRVESTILHLYYVEELTLVEIGRVVGLHFSRVSQLKSQAVLRLRNYMANRMRRSKGR